MAVRLLVIIPGHLSTSPRLLKVADACADEGYSVRVISGSFMPWAAAADEQVAASRSWTWQRVEYRHDVARGTYLRTGVRSHIAKALTRRMGAQLAPRWAVTRAFSRVYDELARVARREPFDLVIGGAVGGLAVVPDVAARAKKPCLLDLEDLHTAESEAADAAMQHASARRILERVLPETTVVTTASEAMADAYHEQFGVRPAVIHNVFPLPPAHAADANNGPLRLYWFSQTIGPGRGLEDAVRAVGHAGIDAVLTLRGQARQPYVNQLLDEARRVAPTLRVAIEPPSPPDDMMRLCAGHDVGLSLECPTTLNRKVCLSNKAFTYLPAGLPVVFSDTPAQRWLAVRLGAAGVVYPSGDARALATHLQRWADDRKALREAGTAARRAACERWRWDHPLERGALLELIRHALA